MITFSASIVVDFMHDVQNIANCLTGVARCISKYEENSTVQLTHMESRRKNPEICNHDSCFLSIIYDKDDSVQQLSEELKKLSFVDAVKVIVEPGSAEAIWIPEHITDLDNFQHLLLKFQPELQTDHPGFHDTAYRQRRQEISQIAIQYNQGGTFQEIVYNETELMTWKHAFTSLKAIHLQRACAEYLEGFKLLEQYCGFSPDEIPQIGRVSKYLEKTTGFRLRPVAGLVSPRDFLANFAFRVFPCTQYLRHHSRPDHTPEPDLIHEFLGHVPMLTNRSFVEFVQEIGLVSLGAPDEVLQKLTTMFWFTVEFGLCKERGQIKALGAGILSSRGEIENAFSDLSEKQPFLPDQTALQSHDDVGYQGVYFVCESMDKMKQQIRTYINAIPRTKRAFYDPYTCTVKWMLPEKLKSHMLNDISDQVELLKVII